MESDAGDEGPKQKKRKQRRNPRACDACALRSIRCQPSANLDDSCRNCSEFNEACTYDRAVRKRGARPKALRDQPGAATRVYPAAPPVRPRTPPVIAAAEWRLLAPSQALVTDLAEVFLAVVYPVFPLFHRPLLMRRVSRGEHLEDRPFYASVMAMCALSSARVRDGALALGTWDVEQMRTPSSEELFEAARRALPERAALTGDFQYMRSAALLAITAVQYGNMELMRYYLNLYHSFVAVGSLHDEANWPQPLSALELEERRRLYWSTYTLDVFTSVIWNESVRSREASSSVAYPSRSDDDPDDRISPSEPQPVPLWLTGWNVVTDLYRILEHATDDLRRVRTPVRRTPTVQALLSGNVLHCNTVLHHVMIINDSLPNELRTTQSPSGDLARDLLSFQAANIAATVQLVRMVFLTNDRSTVEQKCQVASDVIAGFASVPLPYLKAISVPLLHHLAGIGEILGATFEDALHESSYQRVRSVLLELAGLLGDLEAGLYCAAGTSQKLKDQVARIDDYMTAQRWRAPAYGISSTPGEESAGNGEAFSPAPPSAASLLGPDWSPEYHFPPELFHGWSWSFDMNEV